MIVMIYGLPRSGKTTLINLLLDVLKSRAKHMKVGRIINQLNEKKESSNNGILELSKKAIKFIKKCNLECDFILMDCHAGYLSDGLLKDFRQEEYYALGDLFFYLKISPDVILERMKNTNGIKDVYDFSLDDICLYQYLELEKVKYIAQKYKKDIFILDNINVENILKIMYEHL